MILPVAFNESTGSHAMFAQFVNALPNKASTARVVVLASDYLGKPAGLYAYRTTLKEWVRALPLDAVMESMLDSENVSVYLDIPVAVDVNGSAYREAQLQVGHRIGVDRYAWASRIKVGP